MLAITLADIDAGEEAPKEMLKPINMAGIVSLLCILIYVIDVSFCLEECFNKFCYSHFLTFASPNFARFVPPF